MTQHGHLSKKTPGLARPHRKPTREQMDRYNANARRKRQLDRAAGIPPRVRELTPVQREMARLRSAAWYDTKRSTAAALAYAGRHTKEPLEPTAEHPYLGHARRLRQRRHDAAVRELTVSATRTASQAPAVVKMLAVRPPVTDRRRYLAWCNAVRVEALTAGVDEADADCVWAGLIAERVFDPQVVAEREAPSAADVSFARMIQRWRVYRKAREGAVVPRRDAASVARLTAAELSYLGGRAVRGAYVAARHRERTGR